MSKKIKSARGVIIDVDLIKLKQQIASNPAPSNVKAREKFIERKLHKRRSKKLDPQEETTNEQKYTESAKQQVQEKEHIKKITPPKRVNKNIDITDKDQIDDETTSE